MFDLTLRNNKLSYSLRFKKRINMLAFMFSPSPDDSLNSKQAGLSAQDVYIGFVSPGKMRI